MLVKIIMIQIDSRFILLLCFAPTTIKVVVSDFKLFCFCVLTGVWCIQVVVPQRVNTVLGKDVTLECGVEMGASLSHVQTSWERRLPSGSVTMAVYNPKWGIAIPPEFVSRLYFRSPSSHDATIILKNVAFADIGIYTCKVITFPEGIILATTTVNVLGKYFCLHMSEVFSECEML